MGCACACLVAIALELVQVTVSCLSYFEMGFVSDARFVLVNLCIVALPLLVITVFARKTWIGIVVTGVASTLLALVNCYVVDLHGMPLCFTELRNTEMALAMLSGYSLVPSPRAIMVIVFGIVLVALGLLVRRWEKDATFGAKLAACIFSVLGILACLAAIWRGTISGTAPIPIRYVIIWSRGAAASQYGYPVYLFADALNAATPVARPANYSIENTNELLSDIDPAWPETSAEGRVLPNIVIVLNESFYDLATYSGIETDVGYLDAFFGIDGAVYGQAIVPSEGGGTNNTEFELLTSHSMRLMRSGSPFNYVNLSPSFDSVVRYAESIGYETSALHVGDGTNYSRSIAYPAMGFETSILGPDEFPEAVSYGNRPYCDSGSFARTLEVLENAAAPQLVFLLTYQNHGGWEQNEAELDSVHVLGDYGDLTDDLDEYLTSMSQTADAFVAFTEELAQSDRPTVVFMMGDHAPSFISELPYRDDAAYPRELTVRMVPYVVWSNYDVDLSALDGTMISATDVVPLLSRSCGLPQTNYHRFICVLSEACPVRTSYGWYVDANGTYANIQDNPELSALVDGYYSMEYNALTHGFDYQEEWFAACT